MRDRPPYLQVFLTFARNSLMRDMTYRANFIIECVTSLSWVLMNVGFYVLIFEYTPSIGRVEHGWTKYEFFVFMATTIMINSLIQAFFMPNADEFSELTSRNQNPIMPIEASRKNPSRKAITSDAMKASTVEASGQPEK